MDRRVVAAAAALGVILLALGLKAERSQRQDLPRSNDHVLQAVTSPDRRSRAYLVTRVADSLSADIFKVFVSRAGDPWYDGQMVMEGRRISIVGAPLWLASDRLCVIASSDGVEERKEKVDVAGRTVLVRIAPTIDSCIESFGKRAA